MAKHSTTKDDPKRKSLLHYNIGVIVLGSIVLASIGLVIFGLLRLIGGRRSAKPISNDPSTEFVSPTIAPVQSYAPTASQPSNSATSRPVKQTASPLETSTASPSALRVTPVPTKVAQPSPAPSDQLSPESFYTDLNDIPNPTWSALKDTLAVGVTSLGPALGSTIRVNQDLVEWGPYRNRTIPQNIAIHTLTSSSIRRTDFPSMTRWYQEDGNTQIFRLFPGEDNVRNQRSNAPRIEALGYANKWKYGDGWHQWAGRYTFLEVRTGAVFQLKHNETYWSLHISLEEKDDGTFDLFYLKLHDMASKVVLARDVVAKSYDIKVLDDGLNHKVFLNNQLVVENFIHRPPDNENHARWGFYSPGIGAMDRNILIFVTGAYVGPAL
jgi:hypothetical protein